MLPALSIAWRPVAMYLWFASLNAAILLAVLMLYDPWIFPKGLKVVFSFIFGSPSSIQNLLILYEAVMNKSILRFVIMTIFAMVWMYAFTLISIMFSFILLVPLALFTYDHFDDHRKESGAPSALRPVRRAIGHVAS
eukprot:jgi/Botrbrau1/21352/Bobra.0184s0061.1